MFKEIKRGFGFGVGFILAGAVLKFACEELLEGMKRTETDEKEENPEE